MELKAEAYNAAYESFRRAIALDDRDAADPVFVVNPVVGWGGGSAGPAVATPGALKSTATAPPSAVILRGSRRVMGRS